jgi:hypothetical protein
LTLTKEILDGLFELANKYTLKNPHLPLLDDSKVYNPFVESLDEKLTNLHNKYRTLVLPDFHRAETVAVFSDYGGEHKGCKFNTYSFLFCTFEFLDKYNQNITEIREKYNLLKPYKEIAFKDLSYSPLKKALPEILNCANNLINGLLVTVVVDKRIKGTFGLDITDNKDKLYKDLNDSGLNVWKEKVLIKLLYIINTICYFAKLLAVRGQNLFWMTDNDAIVANSNQEAACNNILTGTMNYFTGEDFFKTLNFAKPFLDNTPYDFISLLSMPDLVAGALSDYFMYTNDINTPMISKDETDLILDFISRQGILLRKYSIMFNYEPEKQYSVGSLEFNSTLHNDGISIPVMY